MKNFTKKLTLIVAFASCAAPALPSDVTSTTTCYPPAIIALSAVTAITVGLIALVVYAKHSKQTSSKPIQNAQNPESTIIDINEIKIQQTPSSTPQTTPYLYIFEVAEEITQINAKFEKCVTPPNQLANCYDDVRLADSASKLSLAELLIFAQQGLLQSRAALQVINYKIEQVHLEYQAREAAANKEYEQRQLERERQEAQDRAETENHK